MNLIRILYEMICLFTNQNTIKAGKRVFYEENIYMGRR